MASEVGVRNLVKKAKSGGTRRLSVSSMTKYVSQIFGTFITRLGITPMRKTSPGRLFSGHSRTSSPMS